MEKKVKKILITVATILATVASTSYMVTINSESDLTLANIEALMRDEKDDNINDNGYETCTQADLTANCYDSTGKWCSVRIVSVYTYYRTSIVVNCTHDFVTYCLGDCKEK